MRMTRGWLLLPSSLTMGCPPRDTGQEQTPLELVCKAPR